MLGNPLTRAHAQQLHRTSAKLAEAIHIRLFFTLFRTSHARPTHPRFAPSEYPSVSYHLHRARHLVHNLCPTIWIKNIWIRFEFSKWNVSMDCTFESIFPIRATTKIFDGYAKRQVVIGGRIQDLNYTIGPVCFIRHSAQ